MKNNIPSVRFSKELKEYKSVALEKIAIINPKCSIPKKFKYVDLESVIETKLISYREESKETAPSRAQRLAIQGDIFYQTVRPYQKNNLLFNLVDTDYVFSSGYAQLRPSINGYYLFSQLQNSRFVTTVLEQCTGTSYPAINSNVLSKIEIMISNDTQEHEKIGSFFKNLDDTIALHQQELEALKQTKQGFLQKMFPKDGENIPQFRFGEFTKPWTKIEFEKVIKLVGGATPLKENKEYWNGDIVWLSSQEIKNKYVSKGTYLITEQAVKDNRTKVVSEGTPLIVTRSGILAKRFPISISLNEVAINQDIKALIFDRERFDTEFLVAEIKSNESYILKNIVKTGTTVQSVNLPDLNRMNLYIPEYAEQLKIGEFFRQLDEVIELKEKELEALKETKKGFLQKMFV